MGICPEKCELSEDCEEGRGAVAKVWRNRLHRIPARCQYGGAQGVGGRQARLQGQRTPSPSLADRQSHAPIRDR